METLNQIVEAIMPYVVTIVTAIAGYVAVVIKNKITEKLNTQTKKEVAEATVNYIQQVYASLNGEEKLQKALDTVITWLNEKGISTTEAEARILIEAAIKGFKESWLATEAKQLEVDSMKANMLPEENTTEEMVSEEKAVTNETNSEVTE